jgi:hypothetical protein
LTFLIDIINGGAAHDITESAASLTQSDFPRVSLGKAGEESDAEWFVPIAGAITGRAADSAGIAEAR